MANQEHLDILKQGVEAWNQWRKEHTDIQPDLSTADLNGANLNGANLRSANLRGANLSGIHLRDADLGGAYLNGAYLTAADLTGAYLNGANLSSADLSYTDLSYTDLSYADLSDADLSGVHLSHAYLIDADLSHAYLGSTDLSDADLSYAILTDAYLSYADLGCVDLSRADLSYANLSHANLSYADLGGADLSRANLSYAHLGGADLSGADLSGANLSGADLSSANLGSANLTGVLLIETNLAGASLTQCSIYGISAWKVRLEGAKQNDLVITPPLEPTITVDNLEVAQFIYLLLNTPKIRDVIDTLAKKAVLILGRFTPERREVIDTLSKELRRQKYSPVVFNFEGTENKDFTATVRTLANIARFVLLDLTDVDDAIDEIADEIVPYCVVPIRPLLLQGLHRQTGERLRGLQRTYRWVLAPYRYKDVSDLQSSFQEAILQPIHERIIELKHKKPLKVFVGYALEDTNMLKMLKTHLRPLERAGVIKVWDDQEVAPGEEKGKEIERQLSEARMILLLISPAFLSSHDCYDIQMSMALERYSRAEARVIPILLRPCAWQSTPLKDLRPLPKDGKPISKHNKDDVFFEVSEDIGEVIKILG